VVEACKMLEEEGISAAHYDMRFLKPIDEKLLNEIFANFKRIITVEDGTIVGGLGSAILEFMNNNRYHSEVEVLGIPDEFIEQGTQAQLYKKCGYDAEGIYNAAKILVKKITLSNVG
ncbi:MAG: transketolase C-terminal domain-containing protein, partial [Bacteroidota bacterium]|nr:transketolase C-terminal domain-containing protein [Bacteroidota bacterium]